MGELLEIKILKIQKNLKFVKWFIFLEEQKSNESSLTDHDFGFLFRRRVVAVNRLGKDVHIIQLLGFSVPMRTFTKEDLGNRQGLNNKFRHGCGLNKDANGPDLSNVQIKMNPLQLLWYSILVNKK